MSDRTINIISENLTKPTFVINGHKKDEFSLKMRLAFATIYSTLLLLPKKKVERHAL